MKERRNNCWPNGWQYLSIAQKMASFMTKDCCKFFWQSINVEFILFLAIKSYQHGLAISKMIVYLHIHIFIDSNCLMIKGQIISKWFFGVFDFLQKTNERIRLYYYDTSSWLVFVCFLEEIKDNKKPFRNHLTFSYCIHIWLWYIRFLPGWSGQKSSVL